MRTVRRRIIKLFLHVWVRAGPGSIRRELRVSRALDRPAFAAEFTLTAGALKEITGRGQVKHREDFITRAPGTGECSYNFTPSPSPLPLPGRLDRHCAEIIP